MKKLFTVSVSISFLVFALSTAYYFMIFLPSASGREAPSVETTDRSVNEKYDLLRRLSADVQISYFENLLGSSTYINPYKDKALYEHIFVDKYYFVQAITDENDKVLAYAVTSRGENFQPTLDAAGTKITLNKTSYSEAFPEIGPLTCYFFLSGATSLSFYFEEYYLGNPGLYQYYIIGWNEAAPFIGGPYPKGEDYYFSEDYTIECDKISEESRKSSSPNTYMVFSFRFSPSKLEIGPGRPGEFMFGPNEIQVRTLNE